MQGGRAMHHAVDNFDTMAGAVSGGTCNLKREVASTQDENFKISLCFHNVSCDFKASDKTAGARLNEDCLPDPAGTAVPAPLLANRLIIIVHRVLHPHDNRAA